MPASPAQWWSRAVVVLCLTAAVAATALGDVPAPTYDLVVNHGRVIDPETELDGVRHVGVTEGVIVEISKQPLRGRVEIDATGLVVAPGFIDRNSYEIGPELFRLRASDGVTTTFNFEEGALDVAEAYSAHQGSALIHFGFSAGEGLARVAIASQRLHGVALDASKDPEGIELETWDALQSYRLQDGDLEKLLAMLEEGLKAGAPAIGMGPEYFPASTEHEALRVFELAARYGRSIQIHARSWSEQRPHARINEIITGALATGAPIHLSHLNSITTTYIELYLELLAKAREHGIEVTAECYPYSAGLTSIQTALFDDWEEQPDEYFERLEWPATGERLTRETFQTYRREGGYVIIHNDQKHRVVDLCLSHPLTQVASDGGADGDQSHPRVAGTNTRILGRYVRERGLLSLPEAIAKMSLLPAQSLEGAAPQMARKGRIQKGMDADLVIFDPATVIDRATYSEPLLQPEGIAAVVVRGVVIQRHGEFIHDVSPGTAIRASGSAEPKH